MASNPLIILCGGRSSRMGSPKGLLQYSNKPLLKAHIDNFKTKSNDKVIVVLGHSHKEYLNELPFLNKSLNKLNDNIYTVINQEPERGQFSSLIEGLKAFSNNSDAKACFIQPIDSLPPDNEIFYYLTDQLSNKYLVVKPTFEGRGGHPVLLSSTFIKILLEIDSDDPKARLDLQIGALNENQIRKVPVEDKLIITNVNTLSDYKKIKGV
jgi:molybdenum cofactor cytidylyltransferase